MRKTLGEAIREWREASGLSTTELAEAIGKKRQNIEQFESGEVKQPRYLREMAKWMGISTDDLQDRKLPPPLAQPPAVAQATLTPAPKTNVADLGVFVGQLVDLFTQLTPDQRDELLTHANNLANLGKTKASAQDPFAGKKPPNEKPRRRQRPMLIKDMHRAKDHLIHWVPAQDVKSDPKK